VFHLVAGVLLLGILIMVHEIGHFLAARLAGVAVERFSIGLGPKLVSFRRGETEYALSLIPFGGYVKMAGMDPSEEVDESIPASRTFLGKPIGVRALIVVAGPITNFVWAVLVSAGVLWLAGLPTLGEPIIGGVDEGTLAAAAGLAMGDRVIEVEGAPVSDWEGVLNEVAAREEGPIEFLIEREGAPTRTVVVEAVRDTATGALDLGITAYVPPVLGDVMSDGPAHRAGLRTGDRVVSVAGTEVNTWYELGDMIRGSAGETLAIVWERDGERMQTTVVPEEGEEPVGLTGVRTVGLIGIMRTWTVKKLGLAGAIATGFEISIGNIALIGEFFGNLISGEVAPEMLGGPIRIVQLAGESSRWGASYFFGFMAYLSLNLFLLNMLPLPILDGGHLLLLVLEKVRRRRLTERQLAVWQQIGLVFFACLMVLLIIKDVIRVS